VKNFKSLAPVSLAYMRSMRPYQFFLSGMAAWVGVLFSDVRPPTLRIVTILFIAFIGYGVNQVINDILGWREDRINAPHRPLVTGELPLSWACGISIVLCLIGAVVTFLLNPHALIFYFLVFLLNVVYQFSKKIPVLSNVMFGLLLALCVYYGAVCTYNAGFSIAGDYKIFLVAAGVFLVNFTAVFFTYFKDFTGDKSVGNRTLVVTLTPRKARYLNFAIGFVPFLIVPALIKGHADIHTILSFLILVAISFWAMEYTAFLYYRAPEGKETYYSLEWNFKAAVMFETSLIALKEPIVAILLFIVNYFFMGYLFRLHNDHLA
jgi:geranylgeranylglycerol-phosphate geranylgeranyltransferase